MINSPQITADERIVTVRVPLKLRKRGGRKLLVGEVTPVPTEGSSRRNIRSKTILKALGRAYRWKRILEAGELASIGDLAAVEKINCSYIRRILRLTLLSPAIIHAILEGRPLESLQLEHLLKPFPAHWASQATVVCTNCYAPHQRAGPSMVVNGWLRMVNHG